MRQQGQGGAGWPPARAETPVPTESPTVEKTEEAAKIEETETEDWGSLFGGFFEEPPAVSPVPTEQTQPDAEKMPFLKPGMNASVQISAVNKTGILTLPNEALLDMRGRKMVRIIGADGQPGRPQPIVAGVSSFDKTEILSGLTEGDVVAIGGFQRGGGRGEEWRRMMQNPAATMRRMGGGGGPRGR